MFEHPVVFVDIETTGGGYRNSRVLEVAAIRYENGEVTDEFSTLIDPESHIPSFITDITGITSSDIVGAPKFRDIAEQLAEILDGAVFVAHNVNFDYSFIKNEFAMIGVPFSMKKLCTVRLSRALYRQHKGHSLEKLIQRHNIPFENRHRALDDAKAILYFSRIAHDEHGAEAFAKAVAHQLKTQYVPVNLVDKQIEQIDDSPGVYIFRDKNQSVLYVGKSVTMRTRVLSHFRDMSAKEVKLAEQTSTIETIPTGNEFLALLLESRLIKQLKPIYNRLLRRATNYCMVVESGDTYRTLSYEYGIPSDDMDLGKIYGLYENKVKAKRWMDIHARTFDLCPKLMGLEKTSGACFWYSLGRCKGACIGKESPEAYNARFDIALRDKKLESWPYEGEMVLEFEGSNKLIVENWIVKQVASDIPMLRNNTKLAFDLDEYKIIRNYLKSFA